MNRFDNAAELMSMPAGPAVEACGSNSAPGDHSAREHLTAQWGWHAYLREAAEEAPSWLISLILHLVGFLVVTSLAIPWTTSGPQGSGSIALTLGFAEQTQPAQSTQVTITAEPTPSVTDPLDDATQEDPAAPTRPNPHEPTGKVAQPAASASPRPQTAETSPNPTAPPTSSVDAYRVSPYAALLNRRRPSFGASTAPVNSLEPLSEVVTDPQQQVFDQIVDDFIEYDIGNLRGAAGRQARQRFAELDAESLPALVRGLNKAAGIHASCPVGVIASKLMMMLRNSSEPSLREYAIQHVGRNVPESAPHYHRVMALRKHWLGASDSMPTNVAAIVDRLESRQEGELMELMLALSDAPSDTIVAALRSGDEYLAGAATLAILQGPYRWDPQQCSQLRAAVLHLQTTARNPQIRQLTVDAQRALTR